MRKFIQRFAAAFGSAIILMFFSEFYFVNESPSIDLIRTLKSEPWAAIPGLIEFALYYTIFTYSFLVLLSAFSVRSWAGLLLAGSIFGWLTEAVIVPVVYENIPHSFIFPSISWHAFIDVMLGWYLVRMVMRAKNLLTNFIMFILLGAAWGAWATWFWADNSAPPLISPQEFALLAFSTTVLWLTGVLISDHFGKATFTASKWEIGILGLVTATLFIGMAMPFLPGSLALLPLVGLTVFTLYINRIPSGEATILAKLHQTKPPWMVYIFSILMPATAVAVYLWLYEANAKIPTEAVVSLLFYLGLIGFIMAIAFSMWRKKGSPK